MEKSKKIFISHSTKTPENEQFLKRLCSEFDQQYPDGSFSLLVDKRIRPSTEWFPCLNEYIMECHAAIILLSKAALNSEWVKVEAAVLCARKRANSLTELILVHLENINHEDLDGQPFFNAIRLSDFQPIYHNHTNDEKINKVLDSLKNLQVIKTPFDKMTKQIRQILTPIQNTTPEALSDSLKAIDVTFEQASDDHADSLTRLLLRDTDNIFTHVKTFFTELSHLMTKGQAVKILDIVKGHWVCLDAAVLLSNARSDQNFVAINGVLTADFTADCYSRQAWPTPQSYILVSANANDRTLKQIEETLITEVCKGVPEDNKKSFLHSYDDPLLLVFPYPETEIFPDEDLLKDIRENFKNVTVILTTGFNFPKQLNYVTPIIPLLEDGQEERQCNDFFKAKKYIEGNLIG